MRRAFFKLLHNKMQENSNIWAVTCDLGYGGFDKIRDTMPDRFINVGASEQAGMDMAIGLALSGKIPFIYSITPFLLYRPFESIRTYIDHEKIPVILIASGRDNDYAHDGFSHDATDDKLFMEQFNNITIRHPMDIDDMQYEVNEAIVSRKPYYINLKR